MCSYKSAPCYKFGYQIPSTFVEALAFDKANGNSRWRDATALEMKQLFDYDCFEDGGIYGEAPNPEGYKKIRGRLIYDAKHYGRHKARYVEGGHLTDIPVDSVYSGVVSLCGLCIVTFLAELNNLDLWATDVGNAYLEVLSHQGEDIHRCWPRVPRSGRPHPHYSEGIVWSTHIWPMMAQEVC